MLINRSVDKKLSIIVPIYKVEAYIRESLKSIFRQGLFDSDFEVLLVNDGTPDNSIGVVSDIISQHDNIIVINQENSGVSMARNAGLAAAQGRYVYFMDPDDLLVENALSVLLPKLLYNSPDILMAGYCRFSDGEDYSSHIRVDQHYSEHIKTGEQAFLEDLSPYECYIWMMLIRRDFLLSNNIFFKPFWYEDTLFCQECFIKAKSVVRTKFQLYVYRLREGSFTYSMNLNKMVDLNSCLSALIDLKDTVPMPKTVKRKLMDNVFSSFSYGIWCISHNATIYEERKKIVSDLKAKIPPSQFMFYGNVKHLFVSFMFRYLPYIYLALRKRC